MITINELQDLINRFNPTVKVKQLPKFREEVRYSIDFENGLSIFVTPETIEIDYTGETLTMRTNDNHIIINKYYTHVVL